MESLDGMDHVLEKLKNCNKINRGITISMRFEIKLFKYTVNDHSICFL